MARRVTIMGVKMAAARLLGDSCARASLQPDERFLFNVGVAISALVEVVESGIVSACTYLFRLRRRACFFCPSLLFRGCSTADI